MSNKKIPIYFYYLGVNVLYTEGDVRPFRWSVFLHDFSSMLSWLMTASLSDRKEDFPSDEKIVWLDEINRNTDNEFNLIFKSAKYNHVRNVIDTVHMEEKGRLKSQDDGDEEKTHIAIRYKVGNSRMICLHGNNFYGVTISKIIEYLTRKFECWRQQNHLAQKNTLFKEIMLEDDFLRELYRMSKISLLTLTVDRQDFHDDFLRLANRDGVKETVNIQLRKINRMTDIPVNLVEEYYSEMNSERHIRRITVEGTNETGTFKIDTDSIKKKQIINAQLSDITKEVMSDDFFAQAQNLLDNLRMPSH